MTLLEEYNQKRYEVEYSDLKQRKNYYYKIVKIIDKKTNTVVFEGEQSATPKTKISEFDKKWRDLNYNYRKELEKELEKKYPIADYDQLIEEVNNHKAQQNSELNEKYLLNKNIIPNFSYRDEENKRTIFFGASHNLLKATVEYDEEDEITISIEEYEELKRLAEIGKKIIKGGEKTWTNVSQEERKKIMSERGKVGARNRWAKTTKAERKAHASKLGKASAKKRWNK